MNNLQKPTKKRKPVYKTASEQRHCDAIHALPCIVTGLSQVIWHHCFTGGGGRKNHFKTIPLHPAFHTKEQRQSYPDNSRYYPALHENRTRFFLRYGTETELLCRTYKKLDALGKLEPAAREIWEALK